MMYLYLLQHVRNSNHYDTRKYLVMKAMYYLVLFVKKVSRIDKYQETEGILEEKEGTLLYRGYQELCGEGEDRITTNRYKAFLGVMKYF